MNIVYFIGNGFDIAVGLDTSARSIVRQYKEHLDKRLQKMEDEESNEYKGFEIFASSLNTEIDTWADFEIKLGEISERFDTLDNPEESYLAAFNDFRSFIREHLSDQQERINKLDISEENAKAFQNASLGFLLNGMRPASQRAFRSFISEKERENWSVGFVVFNYTYLIDQIIEKAPAHLKVQFSNTTYSRSFTSALHIHGSLSDEYGLLVGVNGEDQIKSDCLKSSDAVLAAMIKARQNRDMELERDAGVDDLIDSASVIIIHGMSIGDSDLTWWISIGKWLTSSSNRLLILSHYEQGLNAKTATQPEMFAKTTKRYRDVFMNKAAIPDEAKESVGRRILISVNDASFIDALESLKGELNGEK